MALKPCLAVALELLARRDWLHAELVARLKQRSYSDAEIDATLQWLDSHRILNDEKAVERALESNQGRKALAREAWIEQLRQRGADEGLLLSAVGQLPSDHELAVQILEARRGKWKNIGQAARHLGGKGFEPETIESVLETFFDDEFRSQ